MMIRFPAFVLCFIQVAAAQSAPPPPPEDGNDPQPAQSLDLTKIPVPEADLKASMPELTVGERERLPVQISVVPVGYIPPPIITLDKQGMPRETYRNPLEYPPAVYHVKTEKDTIRVMGSQNQIGPSTRVPRSSKIHLSYELPPGENDVRAGTGPALVKIAEFPVPPQATHLVVVIWKDMEAKLWKDLNFKVINVSPNSVKRNEVVVVNASGRDLSLHRGDAPFTVKSGFMGNVALGVNSKGELPLVVAAHDGTNWVQLSRTLVGPKEDERLFLVAWQAPRSLAQPSGVNISPVNKRMQDAEPFEDPGP